MKHVFTVSLDIETVAKIRETARTGRFRNKSHLVEEAINEFVKNHQSKTDGMKANYDCRWFLSTSEFHSTINHRLVEFCCLKNNSKSESQNNNSNNNTNNNTNNISEAEQKVAE